jgi:hypothetical protein
LKSFSTAPEYRRAGTVVAVDSGCLTLLLDYPLNTSPNEEEENRAKRLKVSSQEVLRVPISIEGTSPGLQLKMTDKPKVIDEQGNTTVYCIICDTANSRNNCYKMCKDRNHFSCCKHRFPWDANMHRPPWENMRERGIVFVAVAEEEQGQCNDFVELRFLMAYNHLEGAKNSDEEKDIARKALCVSHFDCDVCLQLPEDEQQQQSEEHRRLFVSVSDLHHNLKTYSLDKKSLLDILRNPPSELSDKAAAKPCIQEPASKSPLVATNKTENPSQYLQHTVLTDFNKQQKYSRDELNRVLSNMTPQYVFFKRFFLYRWLFYLMYFFVTGRYKVWTMNCSLL